MIGNKLKAYFCIIVAMFSFFQLGMFVDAKFIYNIDIETHKLVVTFLVGTISMLCGINLFKMVAVYRHKRKIDGKA
jgi:hypothetical protein